MKARKMRGLKKADSDAEFFFMELLLVGNDRWIFLGERPMGMTVFRGVILKEQTFFVNR